MKSFLEYVCTRLMGRPVSGSCWRCPMCDSSGPTLSVRPPRAGKAVKFKCFRCGAWGDEADILRWFYPSEGYSQRLVRLDMLRRDYDASSPAPRVVTKQASNPGSTETTEDPRAVELALAELIEFMDKPTPDWCRGNQAALRIFLKGCGIAYRNGTTPKKLAMVVAEYLTWCRDSDAAHVVTCEDADCEAAVCRRARGLEPLSPEEIEPGRLERMEAKQRAAEVHREEVDNWRQRLRSVNGSHR